MASRQYRPVRDATSRFLDGVKFDSRAGVETRICEKRQQILEIFHRDLAERPVQVQDLMSHDLEVILPKTTVEEMTALMAERRVRHLLVCQANGRLLGVVSDRDLHNRSGTTAEEVMTTNPTTISPKMPVDRAMTPLINKCISCLPVVDRGRLCGVITTTDLIMVLQSTFRMLQLLVQQQKSR